MQCHQVGAVLRKTAGLLEDQCCLCTDAESTSEESESVSHSVMSDCLQPNGLQPVRPLCPWNSPGKNTGVGIHSLPQGIFPTQGWKLGLLHCRRFLTI